VAETLTLDDLDRQLVQALQLDGRAAFSAIAAVLGVSAHTVARRYRRLYSPGGLRVLGRLELAQPGAVRWFVRLRCTPDASVAIASALARRPDTSFVGLMSGGTELICVTEADQDDAEGLLLRKLPRTPRVVDLSAHCLLHTFFGGPRGWYAKADALRPEQVDALRPVDTPADGEPVVLDETDRRLLDVLVKDGRASHATLQAATGRSESSVRRRLEFLRARGVLYFDVQLDPAVIGYPAIALLWLTVTPARLAAVGEALAAHAEVAFAAATTGPSNVLATVILPDTGDLYRYLTTKIAVLDGVQRVETAPVIRQVKQLAYDPV
jgi:DNA-binding Lrp family transcriptional regulator